MRASRAGSACRTPAPAPSQGVHSSGSVHYKPLAKRVALAALAITLSAKKPDSRALCAKMQGKIGKRRD